MKQLIVDYLPFEIQPHQISEAMKENNGKLVVKGVLQRADTKTQNGRGYPKEILMREAKKYFENLPAGASPFCIALTIPINFCCCLDFDGI